ncbi:MAG: sugar kinase [Clostridia bacterium]|nr:sugar kinase [Clostridia bacterium]
MKVTGFGDYLIHFSPMWGERFMQADWMHMNFTGAEANVCAALAFWGEKTGFVTRLPEHMLARRAVTALRGLGVDMSRTVFGGERMGVYFLEKGASVRASKVIYDRNHSSFTEACYEHFDWDAILGETDILYLTGITPSLSDGLAVCCKKLAAEAARRSVQVVYDVNYRPALSTPEKAASILLELAPYITCLIGNEEHFRLLLGIGSDLDDDHRQERLRETTKQLHARLGIGQIAVTVRRTPSASDAVVYASFSDGGDFAVSPEYRLHVADRVGSGDAFSAGLIYGLIHGYDAAEAVGFAAASNAVKHTILDDFNLSDVGEIRDVMNRSFQDVRR